MTKVPRTEDMAYLDDTAKYNEAMQDIDKMQIWNNQRSTPQEKTKRVTVRGGFTSINPQYQLQRATEQWGPIGDKWGIDIQSTEFVKTDVATIVWCHAKFYYPSIFDGRRVEFDQVIDIELRPGKDTAKVLMTSLRSKALSCLGFSSDVFEGLFDDTQYLQDEPIRERPDDYTQEFIGKVHKITTIPELRRTAGRVAKMLKDSTLREPHYNQIMEAIGERETILLAS